MTGQELYENWKQAQWVENNCQCDNWQELTVEDQTAWNKLGEFVTNHVSECISDVFS